MNQLKRVFLLSPIAFQSKVLRKLYPATSTPAKDHNPPAVVDPKARRTHVKRKTSGDDTVFGEII